jgi:hypothetical protein
LADNEREGRGNTMATTTFNKAIYIDDAAADVLIALLNEPAPPRPEASGIYRDATEEDWKCFMQKHSAK